MATSRTASSAELITMQQLRMQQPTFLLILCILLLAALFAAPVDPAPARYAPPFTLLNTPFSSALGYSTARGLSQIAAQEDECEKLSLQDCAFSGFGAGKCVIVKEVHKGDVVNHRCKKVEDIINLEYNKTRECFSICGLYSGMLQHTMQFKDIMDCDFLHSFCSRNCETKCPSLYNHIISISGSKLLPALCKSYNARSSSSSNMDQKSLPSSNKTSPQVARKGLNSGLGNLTFFEFNCSKGGKAGTLDRAQLEGLVRRGTYNLNTSHMGKMRVAPDDCTCQVDQCSCDCSDCSCPDCSCGCSCGCNCGFSCGCGCGCSCGCGFSGCYCSCGCSCSCSVGCGCGCSCSCGCTCGCNCHCTCPCTCGATIQTIITTITVTTTTIISALQAAIDSELEDAKELDSTPVLTHAPSYPNSTMPIFVTMDLFTLEIP